jgi:large subunit ribosomal protein L19
MAKRSESKSAARKTKSTAAPAGETNLIRKVTVARSKAPSFPKFRAGDTVGVYVKVREGEKERVQLYKGVVIKLQGAGQSRSFTVRKVSSGVGVERTFPFYSPAIDRVEIITYGQVRRGKLLYLRQLAGKAAAIESNLTAQNEMAAEEAAARVAATQAGQAQAAEKAAADSGSENA